jgi:hypothetical protein
LSHNETKWIAVPDKIVYINSDKFLMKPQGSTVGTASVLRSCTVSYLFRGTLPGWTSIILPIYFIGGVQIPCIGIIGEYLGKIYKEVKSRPKFIIETMISKEGQIIHKLAILFWKWQRYYEYFQSNPST